jgi:hypothetical protein
MISLSSRAYIISRSDLKGRQSKPAGSLLVEILWLGSAASELARVFALEYDRIFLENRQA